MNTQNEFNLYTDFFQHKKYIATPVSDHSHKCCEFSMILKGQGYVVIDGVSYDFTDNTIIITPPNAVHSFYGTIEENIYFGFYYKGFENITTAVYTSESSTDFLLKALGSMEHWYNRSGKNSIQIINSYSKIIMSNYFRNRVPSSKSISISFEKAIQYIDSHFNTDIKPEQIAQLSGYSYHHFRHEFKKNFNVTIKEYINEMRIINAKHLLRLTLHSIKYIALECGFSTPAYFVTAFKQSTGISPLEYRNRKNTNIEKYAYVPYEVEYAISSYEKSSFWNAMTNQDLFDFKCDGRSWKNIPFSKTNESVENIITNNYKFDNGLSVVQSIRQYPEFDVIKWENFFQSNKSDTPVNLSNVVDCECLLPFSKKLAQSTTYNTSRNEAIIKTVRFPKNSYEYAYENSTTIQLNDKISFSSCSEDNSRILPFFSVSKNGEGYFIAIGWSGKWDCEISMTGEGFRIKAFIEGSSFSLAKDEFIRTASVYVMKFQNDNLGVHNKWRKFLLSNICSDIPSDTYDRLSFKYPVAKEKPLADIETEISLLNKSPCSQSICIFCNYADLLSEATVEKAAEISKIAHKNGKKTAICLTNKNADNSIGESTPKETIDYKDMANFISRVNVDSFLVDFGDFIPRPSQGTNVIKAINKLYKTIDLIKNECPNLIFENCSGEKNHITLDIEMLSRCTLVWPYPPINCDCVLNKYFPTICCKTSLKNDLNGLLCSFAPMLSFYDDGTNADEKYDFDAFYNLYDKLSRYFNSDYYNISIMPKNNEWVGGQFHDIKEDKGVFFISRKANSTVSECNLFLKKLNINNTYHFESADKSTFEITAKSSYVAGINISIPNPKATKIWFYHSV